MKAKFFFPIFALLSLLCACEGTPDSGQNNGDLLDGKISLLVDHEFIRANGTESAKFTVFLQDNNGMFHDVTANSEIYLVGNDTPLTEPRFVTIESGSWKFYALYGLEVSNEVGVRSVAGIADIPADSAPESTNFHHRILLLQHTGTACPACPTMMSILKTLSEDNAYNTRYNHVASHSYTYSSEYPDLAHSSAADELSRALYVMMYPWVTFNLTEVTESGLADIKARIDVLHKTPADVGIALSASEANGSIYANIAVKAGKSNKYRMAIWLLEDGIFAKQVGKQYSWQDTHNNALRAMVGANKTERIYGKNIGTIEAGQTFESIVAIDIEEDWVAKNCEVMVLITAEDERGNYDVVNTAVCSVGSALAYEYNN